jgi:hypothetical protein
MGWLFDAGLKGGVNYDVLGANGNVMCPCVDHDPADPNFPPGFSPATNAPSFYFRRVEQLRAIQAARGDDGQQIWLLEFGWTADNIHPAYSWPGITESKKADLVVQAFQYARDHWSPWIGVMTLWTLSDPGWSPDREEYWWAITNPDGTTRPAYDKLLQSIKSGQITPPATTLAAQAAPAKPGPTPKPTSGPAASSGGSSGGASSAPAGSGSTASAPSQLRVNGTDGDGLVLRTDPSRTADEIKLLVEGATVTVIGDPTSGDGLTWQHVRDADGAEGWAAGQYLKPV